jgi:hypothetical protein
MSRRLITTVAAAALITLSALGGAVPAMAQNTDPSNPSITLEGEFGGGANQVPETAPQEVGAPPQGGGGMQYETADGTPLNLQNADGAPLDISAIPPGSSAEVYGPGVSAPQPAPAQQAPSSQPQFDVTPMTPEEMAQVEKEQRDFGNAVLAALIGFALVLLTTGVLIARGIRGRKRMKAEALADDSASVSP